MNIDEMRNAITEEFSKAWELNDRGHRVEHFSAVERCGNHINDVLHLGFDPKHILIMAFFHDLFSWCRSNHQLMSAYWIETSNHPLLEGIDQDDLKMIANACREHRSTYKGEYSHTFSELMACADRGFPGKIKGMVERAVLYRLDRGYSEADARTGAIEHLKEKFGIMGYGKYPSMYVKVFGDELEKQRILISAL